MNAKIHTETLPNGSSFQMQYVPGGTFNMGSPDAETDALYSEKPQRIGLKVAPFYIAQYTVTQSLWKSVMGNENNPSKFKGDKHPVEKVSWLNTQEFIKSLNKQTIAFRLECGLGEYRLPTEAEWEYAARGGPLGSKYRYAGSDKLKEVGWYEGNSDKETHEVGLLMPNQLGLYDMSGNVWEWVEDHWHVNYEGAPNDSQAWCSDTEVSRRVLRGGSFFDRPPYCRSVFRYYFAPGNRDDSYGFRLALSLNPIKPIISTP